jgi:retron-type reverse transcriptase
VVQQAVRQVLAPIFEPLFHNSSHGFRPGRGAQTAISEATGYLAAGYSTTVDIDLSKFFDRVNHQRLLSRLAQHIDDGRILKLIHRMLKAKVVLPDGTRVLTEEGAPQGGPITPPTKVQNFRAAVNASPLRKKGEVDSVDDLDLSWLDHNTSDQLTLGEVGYGKSARAEQLF